MARVFSRPWTLERRAPKMATKIMAAIPKIPTLKNTEDVRVEGFLAGADVAEILLRYSCLSMTIIIA